MQTIQYKCESIQVPVPGGLEGVFGLSTRSLGDFIPLSSRLVKTQFSKTRVTYVLSVIQ